MSSLRTAIRPDDHVAGPVTAPLQLVEYGDFECPYCGMAYWEVERLRRALGAQLCFIFRHFPLTQAHPHATWAAEAAEAAAAQDSFWAMHGMLYTHQRALEIPDLMAYAETLGLDINRFSDDLGSHRFAERVRRDFLEGARSGVNGTPGFFLNGERYDGVQTYDGLIDAIQGTGASLEE